MDVGSLMFKIKEENAQKCMENYVVSLAFKIHLTCEKEHTTENACAVLMHRKTHWTKTLSPDVADRERAMFFNRFAFLARWPHG